jgi:hypothetical protein
MSNTQYTMAELDLKIAELEHELRRLKQTRNSMAPIIRVPTEIIVRILRTAQSSPNEMFPRANEPYWPKVSRTFMHAMSLCRHWREVAIGTCSLWTAINVDYAGDMWYQVCLQRAGNHRLDICGTVSGRGPMTTSATLLTACIQKSRTVQLVIVSALHHHIPMYMLPASDTQKWLAMKSIEHATKILTDQQLSNLSVDIYSRYLRRYNFDPHEGPLNYFLNDDGLLGQPVHITQLLLHPGSVSDLSVLPLLQ